ncbi:hypothetical protein ASG92_03940 [Arthrobacter sp. Soil736]|uniref:hypothetical protein n=1 Tax=Arthrobacter sp. Soil736 TaxID=1736395 RepID=UPI0006FB14B8|nr:hypothetical protein [Arthrobacter sp. Soil736]KRE64058.1 hypothetical protein ASG92_03940 [Arthrobacter sp. Soil736]
MSEQPAPYASTSTGAVPVRKRVRIHHLREMKERGEKWAMLTAYDKCFNTAVRFMKEANAHAVKLEGGEEMVPDRDAQPGRDPGDGPYRVHAVLRQAVRVPSVLTKAAMDYAADVADGTFPGPEHTF